MHVDHGSPLYTIAVSSDSPEIVPTEGRTEIQAVFTVDPSAKYLNRRPFRVVGLPDEFRLFKVRGHCGQGTGVATPPWAESGEITGNQRSTGTNGYMCRIGANVNTV